LGSKINLFRLEVEWVREDLCVEVSSEGGLDISGIKDVLWRQVRKLSPISKWRVADPVNELVSTFFSSIFDVWNGITV
jgi:hypothetical protein